ncbi:MAG: c-type cytochrome [Gammaproteobacteria bacterium]|nr:c-type cytochrome [Gammaproteobacteria bacterium]
MARFSFLFTVCGFAAVCTSLLIADHNTPEALEARVVAVGTLNISDTSIAAAEPQGPVDGESVYNASCLACHAAGVAGAPVLGDSTVWAERIAQGMEVLVEHAIQGFTGSTGVMPAKGGNPSLSDEAVTVAVQFMVDQSR